MNDEPFGSIFGFRFFIRLHIAGIYNTEELIEEEGVSH